LDNYQSPTPLFTSRAASKEFQHFALPAQGILSESPLPQPSHFMHGTLLFSLGLAASTLIFPSVSQAAIAVGVIGATENFDAAISTPGASPSDPSWTWTTSSNAAGVPGSGSNTTVTDPAGMDALVAPIIAGNVSVAIADTAATGTSNSAQRNSNNLNIQTIPTGSAFLIIMGAFQNTSAIAYSGALVSYTHAALNAPNETEVAGYRGYVSIDGTTFTNVPDFNRRLIPPLHRLLPEMSPSARRSRLAVCFTFSGRTTT
jgi:hypothetical protein